MSVAAGWHVPWGLRPYAEIHALQERVVVARAEGRVPNVLLTGEHPPVVTLGRKTPKGSVAATDIPVVEIERGGEATYHGPGQLVAYPVVHLIEGRRDLHRFQRDLEEIGIRTCADLGVAAGRREGLTGVWVDGTKTGPKKVMSLGIAVRRWVTWHGLALNVWTNLAPFRRFNPCGLDGAVMTSLSELLGRDVSLPEVVPALVRHASELLPGGPFEPRALAQLTDEVSAPASPSASEGAAGSP